MILTVDGQTTAETVSSQMQQEDPSVTDAWKAEEPTSGTVGASAGEAVRENVTEAVTQRISIWVHVCGQVCRPGVYELLPGSRVWDAVEAAGGFTDRAAPEAVNLALTIADGSKITIPALDQVEDGMIWYEVGTGSVGSGGNSGAGSGAMGSVPGSDSGNAGSDRGDGAYSSGLVDINRADVGTLMTIPGIGQVRAEAIVAHRKVHGPFGSIEEIMEVTGIKEGLFAKIRDYITVGG